MTTLYHFRFNDDERSVSVLFVDNEYDISNAEQLAQIGSLQRRTWALKMIQFILKSEDNVWMDFDLDKIENCSFGQRLKLENWNNPAVVLLLADNQYTLYLYRYYLLFFTLFEQFINEYQIRFVSFLLCRYLKLKL